MTAKEYRKLRNQLGLTQEKLADMLGVKRLAIIRRESGHTITKEAELALRCLANHADQEGGES